MGLERRVFVHDRAARHLRDAVDGERRHENDPGLPSKGDDRLEEVLGCDHGVEEQIGRSSGRTGGQVVDDVDVGDGAGTVIRVGQRSGEKLDGPAALSPDGRIQAATTRARPDEKAEIPLIMGEKRSTSAPPRKPPAPVTRAFTNAVARSPKGMERDVRSVKNRYTGVEEFSVALAEA